MAMLAFEVGGREVVFISESHTGRSFCIILRNKFVATDLAFAS
jgi:hypothetical protein